MRVEWMHCIYIYTCVGEARDRLEIWMLRSDDGYDFWSDFYGLDIYFWSCRKLNASQWSEHLWNDIDFSSLPVQYDGIIGSNISFLQYISVLRVELITFIRFHMSIDNWADKRTQKARIKNFSYVAYHSNRNGKLLLRQSHKRSLNASVAWWIVACGMVALAKQTKKMLRIKTRNNLPAFSRYY